MSRSQVCLLFSAFGLSRYEFSSHIIKPFPQSVLKMLLHHTVRVQEIRGLGTAFLADI